MKELILKQIFYIPTEPEAHLTPLGTPCAVNTWAKRDRFQIEVFHMLSAWTNHHIRMTTEAEAHLPSPHLYWSIQKQKSAKQGTTQITLAKIDGKGGKLSLLYLVMVYVESCCWAVMTKCFHVMQELQELEKKVYPRWARREKR